jgi:hypothetical protein
MVEGALQASDLSTAPRYIAAPASSEGLDCGLGAKRRPLAPTSAKPGRNPSEMGEKVVEKGAG